MQKTKIKSKNKLNHQYNFELLKTAEQKLTPEMRQKLIAKKLTDSQKQDAIKLLTMGYSVWDVAKLIHEFNFQRNDKRTWVFYARINSLRHKYNLTPVKLQIAPQTTQIINQFVKKFGEEKLRTILSVQLKIKK